MRFSLVVTALAAMLPNVGFCADNSVHNGLFQANISGQRLTVYADGTIGAWAVTKGSVDVRSAYFVPPPVGGNTVDLNGATAGSIEQTLNLTQDGKYLLHFELSGNWDGSPLTKTLHVTIGDTLQEVEITKPAGWSPGNMQWRSIRVPFAAAASSTLTIKAQFTRRK